jgi:superfamily II DNA helicase RecQ
VQDDIAAQLGMADASRFIYGFRRENLAIEVVEMSPSMRSAFVADLLQDPARRPAIVYAPTRKQAEALAAELSSKFPSAAYHAGLDPRRRETVQQEFQQGRLHAVVATVAFGMGIDKADVRTIVHTSLPGTLEAYYQEIGRAGRDGLPSRAILLYSYADRKMHEFFFERDYPPVDELDRVYRRLGEEPLEKESLRAKLRMESDLFDRVLEKLVIHGGGAVDFDENAVKGAHGWRDSYAAESQRRKAQLDLALQYAVSSQCRMTSLIRHFGDVADARRPCGHCDVCAPEACVARRFRAPSESEKQTAWAVIHALKKTSAGSTGKLHKDMFPREQVSRDDFENLLQALAGAGLVRLEELSFEKDGRSIAYRNASLTQDGEELPPTDPLDFVLPDNSKHVTPARRKSESKRGAKSISSKSAATPARSSDSVAIPAHAAAIEDKLRNWRLAEARKHDVPAFCILGNKTIRAIAEQRPITLEELRSVSGIGPSKAEKFGEEICRICAQG